MFLYQKINLNTFSSNMEQATNQFNKGLQMDTNPMVQGNDTLTDCLNGTLITMNGNEVILQNDMGNRRVSNAFLPPGYEPVGMKEYGGIIYVAAYNPITNKSQIGSFPSPQRKIDSLNGDLKSVSIDFEDIFFSVSNICGDSNLKDLKGDEIYLLKSDSFMFPLTNNVQIHSGDKFVVYAPGLSQLKGLISNYDNIEENSGKIFSPKNRKYTLQLGVLNSQNEFVDITKTLERWEKVEDNWEIIPNNSENSEEFRFNKGYFIPDGFTDKLAGQTIDDANLLLERQKLSTNTYAYKLVGPLYLKVIYNHIQNFSYNIDADISDITENGVQYKELEFSIEGFITYNCPDTETSEDPIPAQSEKYYTYDEVTPDDSLFGFHLIGYEKQDEYGYGLQEQIYSPSVYDPITNTYSAKITKTYKIKITNFIEKFKYTIGVFTGNTVGDNPIYLKECSSSGELNLSLLRSSRVFFKEWRFFNNVDEGKTTLLYNLNCYPKKNKQFKNLKFHFEELVKNGETPESFDYPFNGDSLPVNNGRTIQVINWEDKIKKRKVYKITASYDICDKNTEEVEIVQLKESEMQYQWHNSPQQVERWFLSTELLNSLYSQSSGILDFCNPDYSGYYIIQEKLTVPYELNIQKGNISQEVQSSKKLGNFFAFNNKYANYSYQKDSNYTVEITPSIELLNTELYPEFISLPQNYSLSLYGVSNIKIGKKENTINQATNTALCKVSENIRDVIGFDDSQRSDFKDKELVNIYVYPNYSDNIITLETKCMHYFRGQAQTINQLENPFIDLKKGLAQHLPKSGYFGGVYPNNNPGVSSTMHNINYYYNQQSYLAGHVPSESSEPESTNIGETKNFHYQDIDDHINELFNNHSFQSQVIQFIFPQGGTTHQYHQEIETSYGNNYARVWWKGRYRDHEYWYPLSKLLSKSDWEKYLMGKQDLGKFFLKDILGIDENYVYSPEKLSTNSPIGVAKVENSIYTSPYSFPISLDAEFHPVGNIILQTLNYGCLIFHSYFGSSIKQTVENIITVESDSNFLEDIEQYDSNNIKNIKNIYYSEDNNIILDSDDNGAELDPNEQYKLDTDSRKLHKIGKKLLYLKEQENIRIPLGTSGLLPNNMTGEEDSYSTSQQNGTTKLSYA